MTSNARPAQRGFSLIETLVRLALSAGLLLVAIPYSLQSIERQRIKGTADAFTHHFQFARLHALALGQSTRIGFGQNGEGSCYVVYTGALGQCTCNPNGPPRCEASAQAIVQETQSTSQGLRLAANVNILTIDGQRGTVTPTTTVRIQGDRGQEWVHVVALTGRLRSCGMSDPSAVARCS